MRGPRDSIRRALDSADVIWLSSIRPDGRPHVLPLWFDWDGQSMMVFSKPHAQKVRNLRADPAVMVAVGEPGIDFDVELIDATAQLEHTPTREVLPASFVAKYGERMTRCGLTYDLFAAVYSQPIRILPQRWLDWGGRGWIDRRGHPAVRGPQSVALAR